MLILQAHGARARITTRRNAARSRLGLDLTAWLDGLVVRGLPSGSAGVVRKGFDIDLLLTLTRAGGDSNAAETADVALTIAASILQPERIGK